MPQIAGAALYPHQSFFDGGDSANRPDADKAAGFVLGGTPDLHAQPEHLDKQNCHEHDEVSIAGENGFHDSSFKVLVSSFYRVSDSLSETRSRNSKLLFDRDLSQKLKVAERSEEHTSELQSRLHLVCRLLLEKKKMKQCP